MATSLVIHRRDEVGSTQTEAVRLAESTGDVPLLLVADRQTSGRGRAGRPWLTAPRALACTLVTVAKWPADRRSTIPLTAGLAARQAIRERTGITPGLKWPNDLVTDRGKVGGLLVRATGDLAAIGLGVNLWWPHPPEGMAGLHDRDPGPDAAAEIAATWAERLLTRLGGDPGAWGRDEYRAACDTLGGFVTWEPSGRGKAVDVAGDGGLVVETERGRQTLHSGEVHTLRDATLSAGDHTGGSPE